MGSTIHRAKGLRRLGAGGVVASLVLTGCDPVPLNTASEVPSEAPLGTAEANPTAAHFASEIQRDETVRWFPTYGYRADQTWHFQLHGFVFEPEFDSRKRKLAVESLTEALEALAGAELDEDETERRLALFLVDSESGKRLTARVANEIFDLGVTNDKGVARRWISTPLGLGAASRTVAVAAVLPPDDDRSMTGDVHLTGPEGSSIVTDVDDTIKISEVRDRSALMQNTFSRPWRAVEDVAARLIQYHRAGATVHYLSSMPWQLYPEFEAFQRSTRLPKGSVHLRPFRTSQFSSFVDENASQHHKLSQLREIFGHFPQRDFTLLGDSGERDPEVYAQIAREFPARVKAVWIRDVTGEPRQSERYERLVRETGLTDWVVFESGAELPDAL